MLHAQFMPAPDKTSAVKQMNYTLSFCLRDLCGSAAFCTFGTLFGILQSYSIFSHHPRGSLRVLLLRRTGRPVLF